MNTTPFPRLVWAVIWQFLRYRDRCNVRATCRWLAKIPNREPLRYWLERDDPIILNFRDPDSIKLYNGIYVEKLQDRQIWSQLFKKFHPKVLIENFEKISRHYHARPYDLWKTGKFEIVEFVLKRNPNVNNPNLLKYFLATRQYDKISTVNLYGDFAHYYLLKFNGPTELILKSEISMSSIRIRINYFKTAIHRGEKNICFENIEDRIIFEFGFCKACKYNNSILAEQMLNKISDFNFAYIHGNELYSIFKIENDEIIKKFIAKLKKIDVLNMVRDIFTLEHFSIIKRLLRIYF